MIRIPLWSRWLLALSATTWSLLAAYAVNLPPKISISIPDGIAVEGREITLYITIDHMASEDVNASSFQLDGNAIKVEAEQQRRVAPEAIFESEDEAKLVVTRYRTVLPKRESGVYSIGPVTVEVSGVRYSSNIISLHVQPAAVSEHFRLEARVLAPPKIFPGQEVVFEYRIFFRGMMELLREELPMLNVPGFLTTVSPEVATERSGAGYVQIIRQRARAVTPGTHEIGLSTIEGMAAQMTEEGTQLQPPLYRAEVLAPPITILPFPEANRPPFFDGALGSFVWRTSATGGSDVKAGDSVRIEYRVSGRGELATVQFPALDRLPGLTDNFWTDASPPIGKEEGGTKTFVLVARPKRSGPLEIPGFFTASFDPYSEQYLTATVAPVKLMVEGSQEGSLEHHELVTDAVLSPPFEIDETTISERQLSPFWIIAVAAGAVIIGLVQIAMKRQLRYQGEQRMTSRDLFYRAVMNRSKREKGLQLLRQAFYAQLFEMRLTPTLVDSPEAITGDGLVAEVKALLQLIDRQLYQGGEQRTNLQDIYDEASSLYYRVKQLRTEKE